MDQPIVPLAAFLVNHHLLSPFSSRPRWRVLSRRSESYVEALGQRLTELGAKFYLSTAVNSVQEFEGVGVLVDGVLYDHAVLATHGPTALKLIQAGVGEQRLADPANQNGSQNFVDRFGDLLQQIRYLDNDIVLHSDASLMPRSKDLWASWNVLQGELKGTYLEGERPEQPAVCVTYWLNLLQVLETLSLSFGRSTEIPNSFWPFLQFLLAQSGNGRISYSSALPSIG